MEWYVYYYDCNAKKICKYNVFDHGSFIKELKVLLRCDLTRETFADQLKHITMYYYWSKCEWETVLKPWVGDDSVEMKIDVYDQLMLNWDKFVDYTWNLKNGGNNMNGYSKPTLEKISNVSEGIYMSSGANNGCESQYMNGVWHQQRWNITKPTPRIDAYGCRGCAADDGHKCKLQSQSKWDGGVFKPLWEQDGEDPYEKVNY